MTDEPTLALSVDALGPRLTGIGRYCLELTNRLPKKLGLEKVHFFRGSRWIDDPHELLQENWIPAQRPIWRRSYDKWQRRHKLRDAVVHAPNYFLPAWAERGVATIHDLSVFLFPETHPIERVNAFEREFRQTLDQARVLVTDSETVRQELVAMFAIAPERIQTVPLGIPQVPDDLDLTKLRALGLQQGRYILCVSTFEPRKRIDRLVDAYLQVPAALRLQFPLVLAGASGWRNDMLNAKIEEAGRDGTVRRLGFVPDPTLHALYGGTALFIYPSLYEGFGLPVVEALAHGAPCIIADSSCLLEVAKGAAKVVNPEDRSAFGLTIQEALEDNSWRESASAHGRAVAKSYSWDACISEMTKIYKQLAGD